MLPENARVDSTLHVRGLVTGGVFFSYLLSRFEDEMLNGCCAYFLASTKTPLIIFVVTFGCPTAAVVADMAARAIVQV